MKQKNNMEFNQKNKCNYVGVNDSVRPILKRNTQKGITLVALVITIIVLLILAGVSIKIAFDGGLITKSSDATKQHTFKSQEEAITTAYAAYQMELAQKGGTAELELEGASTELTSEGWKITFPGATENIAYTINSKGEITGPITETKTEDDISIEKYALGENLKGQLISNIINMEDGSMKSLNGKDVVLLKLGFLNATDNIVGLNAALYISYNNKVYRALVDCHGDGSNISIWTTKGIIKKMYEPKGREGQKVEYSYDGTEENKKEWTILYDYGDTVEIISPDALGELTLGYDDEKTQGNNNFEKAVYSYNNSIDRMNNYAASLITNNNKISVRNAGSNPTNPSSRNTKKYTSQRLENWNCFYGDVRVNVNAVGEDGENNLEQDLARMTYWKQDSTNSSYWLSSRVMIKFEDRIEVSICKLNPGEMFSSASEIWSASYSVEIGSWGSQINGYAGAYNSRSAVRPIVKISYPQK